MSDTPDHPDFWQRALRTHRPEVLPDPEETTMTDQFIDQAKLEAVADTYLPDWETNPSSRAVREGFLLGVEAARVLLNESASTEWGVQSEDRRDPWFVTPHVSRGSAEYRVAEGGQGRVVSRHVLRTDWTSNEGTKR